VQVDKLVKHYQLGGLLTPRRLIKVKAVDEVSFAIDRGETLGLVGESGCGKSTVARCVLRLVTATTGSVQFDGQPIFDLDRGAMQRLRRRMQIVFQHPAGSLNPRLSVRATLSEPLRIHLSLAGPALDERLVELIGLVGLQRTHLDRYPHQLSGGQQQRVGIARAIATNPDFIVLDEPTSSLDVSVQGQILRLLQELQSRLGLAYLFISHDLSVVKHVCSRVAVMYLGRIVESGSASDVFDHPQHPYTRALLSAVPSAAWGKRREWLRLKGEIPSPLNVPRGCRLSARCPLARVECTQVEPELVPLDANTRHAVACYAATGWPGAR
jgi:oligopeptide transport system ATP-binding protein